VYIHTRTFISAFLLIISINLQAESFNTGQVITMTGKKDVLADDEGYLYMALNTNTNISRITIDGVGFGRKIRFNDIKKGQNYALLKVKAGDYYWEYINIYVGIGLLRKYLTKDDYSFTVKPGVVNYPGSWKFGAQWVGNFRARMNLQNYNHLSYELQHYKKEYQELIGTPPFEYQGQIKDPYGDFLTEALEKSKSGALPNLHYRSDRRSELPMTIYTKDSLTLEQDKAYPAIRKYLQYDKQSITSVSPDDSYLLFKSVLDEVVLVGIIDVESYEFYVLYQQKLPPNTQVSELEWIDKDSFFLTLSNNEVDRSYVAHLSFDEQQNTINARFVKFRQSGTLLDGLVKQENKLFFVSDQSAGRTQNNGLYHVDVTDEKSIDQSFRKVYKNTKKLKNVLDWLVDKDGVVRAAISIKFNKKDEDGTLDYWFLSDPKSKQWEKIKSIGASEYLFWLKALSADEQYFLVLTNEFSDKYAIHKYATADGAHLGVYYEDAEYDISDILIDPTNQQVIGYTYFENGLIQANYFTALDDKLILAQENNPGLQLFQVQNIQSKNRLLLYGLTPQSKGSWYLLNTQTGQPDKVFDTSPQYEELAKGQYHVLHTQAEDGVELEGFLVMPDSSSNKKHPLVVMPHGGPIGVRDFAHNNEMQHFLASQGIATLKVNFRGSGGYGKEFKELGKQQWGEKIEQDIYTVTQYALNKYAIDSNKICAMGGSYGGYSSLMLTYLYPETYLCAISFAGVMDLPLLFTSRDLSRDEWMQELMTEIVGNPSTEIDKLINKSPLYLLEKMKKPLLLFQGLKDARVRVEHVLRMQQLISLYEMDHEVVIFEDEGHSYSQKNTVILYLSKSLEFIKKHLQVD